MGKLAVVSSVGLLLLLLGPPVAWPDDLRPPAWRGHYPQEMTFQEWMFETPANPAAPELEENPFGSATASMTIGLFGEGWFFMLPGLGDQMGFWDLGGEGGRILIDLDNATIPNAYKEVHVQVTYFLDLSQPPTVEVPGGQLVEELSETGVLVEQVPTGGEWLLDLLVFRIEPSPGHEQIIVRSDPGWGSVIDQIIVDTRCVPDPADITDVYWNQATTSVKLTFTSTAGGDYTVETAEADAYTDGLTWSDLTTLTAVGAATTVTDDLSTNPLSHAFRFYRVRRTSGSGYSRQTAAVFELAMQAGPLSPSYFIGTPLIPDPDHASVREVFGEQLEAQIPRNGLQVSDLDEDIGGLSAMRYNFIGEFDVIAGSEFNIEAGKGYELLMGFGPPLAYTLRLTGYVSEHDLVVPLTKAGTQSLRWFAYSLPRPMPLNNLGIETAVTPWSPLNQVRLLPLGTNAWSAYEYNGTYWYDIGDPAIAVNPTIEAGMGIVFIRLGPPDATDALIMPKWYLHPPNTW